jgi:hypothetical protein
MQKGHESDMHQTITNTQGMQMQNTQIVQSHNMPQPSSKHKDNTTQPVHDPHDQKRQG